MEFYIVYVNHELACLWVAMLLQPWAIPYASYSYCPSSIKPQDASNDVTHAGVSQADGLYIAFSLTWTFKLVGFLSHVGLET